MATRKIRLAYWPLKPSPLARFPWHSEPLPNTHDRPACRAWLARYRFREIGRYVRASRWERRVRPAERDA